MNSNERTRWRIQVTDLVTGDVGVLVLDDPNSAPLAPALPEISGHPPFVIANPLTPYGMRLWGKVRGEGVPGVLVQAAERHLVDVRIEVWGVDRYGRATEMAVVAEARRARLGVTDRYSWGDQILVSIEVEFGIDVDPLFSIREGESDG